MPFPQDQVAWVLANREKIARYSFIPQFLAAALFLSLAYATGHVHAHLLFKGARTRGTIVDLKPVKFSDRSSSGSNWYTTIYEPLVEFSAGMGWSVPVIYDPADPSFALIDRGSWNWLPWAPCFVIGLPVALASLRGFLAFFARRARTRDLSSSS